MENEKKELTFTQKLLAVQMEILPIKKDLENPFFKSMYFDINAIIASVKPILNKYGLVVEQPIMIENGRNILQTFIKDTESKEATVSSIILPDLQDPQKLGAVISYFRRYSLQSLLFLEAEDTDANDTATKTLPNAYKKICDNCGEKY